MPIYMKYEGIEGPLKGKYAKWIELTSAQIGAVRNAPGTAGGSGRSTSISEIAISKFLDTTSHRLYAEFLNGQGRNVTIAFTKSDKDDPYLKIEMENVLISNYSSSGKGDNGSVMEMISLNFTKILFIPNAAATDSNDRLGYDLAPAKSF